MPTPPLIPLNPAWRVPLLASLASLLVFLPGINWGLPSRDDDRFLFGDRTPWTGAEIVALAGAFEADAGRGADVDANPLGRSAGPSVLNDTDEKRAEIVRRYRLQSHQPDEFINFSAIAGMGARRDLDPRLYQYGGLWIYPVAGLLGVAHVVGYVHLTGDLAWYLDRPEEFGRFYVVARLYSAIWGAIGAAAVCVIVRRLTRSDFAGFCGALAFALLPVVVTAAHEAKPHLAGAVLVLLAVLKADDYVRTGRRRDALWAGALCGGAAAMVVSMVVSFAILPVMALLRWRSLHGHLAEDSARRDPSGRGLDDLQGIGPRPVGARLAEVETRRRVMLASIALALLAGIALYAATNPYVIYHALFDRAVFQSNISNSSAMYGLRDFGSALASACWILSEAVSRPLLLGSGVALIAWLVVRARSASHGLGEARPLGWLLLTGCVATLMYFVPLAEAKPAEYARFGILPACAVIVFGAAAVSHVMRWHMPRAAWASALLAILVAPAGIAYLRSFLDDSGRGDTRIRLAEQLEAVRDRGVRRLALRYDPAPWGAPPFDLWHWDAIPMRERSPEPAVAAYPVDQRTATPASWANKRFVIVQARSDSP